MALFLHKMMSVLVFAMAISSTFEASTSQVLKGTLSCLDCSSSFDFSGIKVGVKCDQVKELATTMSDNKGRFEVDLPKSTTTKTKPLNCLARILGGPTKIYASKQNMVSKVVKKSTQDSSTYSTSSPLAFYTSIKDANGVVSSKTIDLPVPREWGLAPTSYYVPFIPIIGIP